MVFIPESAEVLSNSISDIRKAIVLGQVTDDPSIPAAEFMPKFLQGAIFLTQCTLVILRSILEYLEVLGVDLLEFSFGDLLEFNDDHHRVVLDTLFKTFLMQDAEGFRIMLNGSYCQGFDATVPWFLALITTLSYLEDVAGGGDGDEEDCSTEEGNS